MRLVIGHGHRLYLDSLAAVLAGQPRIEVAAAETTVEQVCDGVARHLPDVCLLAATFPVGDGLAAASAIRASHPGTKVVILASNAESDLMPAAVEAGADAFVSTDGHVENIVGILSRVTGGEKVFGPNPTVAVVRPIRPASGRNPLWDQLTVREQEVLVRMMDGECTRQMAKSLAISVSTARTHIENVLTKLGAHSRLEATALAARAGLPGTRALTMPARAAGRG